MKEKIPKQLSFLPSAIQREKNSRIKPDDLSKGPLFQNPIFYSSGGEIITVVEGDNPGTVHLLVEDFNNPEITHTIIMDVKEYRKLNSEKTQRKLRKSKP